MYRQHTAGSGRAGGGRSRHPLGSRHRPSAAAARPPGRCVLRPHGSWTAGAGRVGGTGQVEQRGWAAGLPPVLRSQPRAQDSGPQADSSQGGGAGMGPSCGKRGRENPVQHMGGGQAEKPSFSRRVASAVTQAAAEQALPQPAPGPGFLPVGGPDSRAQGRRQTGQREMGCPGHPEITDSNTPGEGEGGTSHALLGHHL